jgi:hypothetical protein
MAPEALEERLNMRNSILSRTVLASCAGGIAFAGLMLLALPAHADKFRNPTAVFAGLDKITGRIISFEASVDETIQFGSLQLTPRVCFSRSEDDIPRTTTFIEVEEVGSDNQFKKIFAGWMFAASPGLNAIDHPVYDVWLTECQGARDPQDRIKTQPEQDDVDDTPAPLSADRKLPPKTAEPLKRKDAATNAPLRLPDATGVPLPSATAPRVQPRQSFFPTNSGSRGGAAYDPASGMNSGR